ncbi:hypothetical protein QTH91_16330 [Variovorax dokdonensis]|uniref:Uncharacterized protein n=1 Tax=Variovorax dokdonensis TaxID=344883 RepID=A0ABT7NDP9_9BURK|nr:hypothetical protein [Variovorax dokdonensis]MDM0046058.1 hypothetical protein [Variovorax dokdonensis]
MPHLLASLGAIAAALIAAPFMLFISLSVLLLMTFVYIGFAARAISKGQPFSLHDFFYKSWN